MSDSTSAIELNISSNETGNYNDLINKPTINGVEIAGELTTSDLGIEIPEPTVDVPVLYLETSNWFLNNASKYVPATIDATWNEIKAAVDAGKLVFMRRKYDYYIGGGELGVDYNVSSRTDIYRNATLVLAEIKRNATPDGDGGYNNEYTITFFDTSAATFGSPDYGRMTITYTDPDVDYVDPYAPSGNGGD